MVLKNNNNNDAFQANYNFLQLSDSIKEIAVIDVRWIENNI